MITLYIGPMWAGKTQRLASAIATFSIVHEKENDYFLVYDDLNNRNSERDLRYVLPTVQTGENKLNMKNVLFATVPKEKKDKIKMVIFDEVHLYQTLGKENLFWTRFNVWRKEDVNILMASVYLDCYAKYEPFSLITKIIPFCDDVVICSSFKSCAACGSPNDVFYTRNIGDNQLKIGDHYENVCRLCVGTS